MAVKEYKLFATKAKIARENNLTEAKSHYYSGNDLYYDFALFEKLEVPSDVKELIKTELMEHHAVSWFDQPLPVFVEVDRFTRYYGNIRTATHRVYKANGKRVCVIIEVTAIDFQKLERKAVWSKFIESETEYKVSVPNYECDYEVA